MDTDRRGFVSRLLMLAGLGSAVATAGAIAGRYLYPLKAVRLRRKVFLAPAADLPAAGSKPYRLPGGATALVTNTGTEIVALSDVCPHLGCKVRYYSSAAKFLCPCHGGVFDKDGKAVSGPPAEEGKNLTRYAITRVGENLFIEIEETAQA